MNEIEAVEGTCKAIELHRDPDQCHAIVFDFATKGPTACGPMTFHELITALIVVVQSQAEKIAELERDQTELVTDIDFMNRRVEDIE